MMNQKMEAETKVAIYVSAISALTYVFTYGISTSLFASSYQDTDSFFGSTKNAITIAQMIGFEIGKLIGALFLSKTRPASRLLYLAIVLSLSLLPLILFGIVPTYWKVIMVGLSGIPFPLVWGVVIFYVEGRRATEVSVMFIYMLCIIGSGASKNLGSYLANIDSIGENWMPAICGTIGFIGCLGFGYLLDRTPPPTENELATRSARKPGSPSEQSSFFYKYHFGLITLGVVYGTISFFRNYRDFFALEMWNELLGENFDSGIFSISEIIVSIVVTTLFCILIFIKTEKTSLFVIMSIMLTGGVIILITTLIYEYVKYSAITWIILGGIGMFITYIPPGAILYDKMMGATENNYTTIFIIFVSEVFNATFTLAGLIVRALIPASVSYVTFYVWLSYISSAVIIVGMITTMIYFYVRMDQLQREKMTRKNSVGSSSTLININQHAPIEI